MIKNGLIFYITIAVCVLTIIVFGIVYYVKFESSQTQEEPQEEVIANIKGDEIESTIDKNKNNEIRNIPSEVPTLTENSIPKETQTIAETTESYVYKFYYSQLDDSAKKIYDAIEKNIENIKSGTYTITVPEGVGEIIEQPNGEEILNMEFQSAWDAIVMDRVELFYIDVSKVSLEILTTTYRDRKTYKLSMKPNTNNYLDDSFNTKQAVDDSLAQLERIRKNAVERISGSDYEKIEKINDILVDSLDYDTENGNNAYNIYGALIQKRCVCEGYAESFKYIMDAYKIPCILVIGTAQNSSGAVENHEWNYVLLDNKWYAVDVTWNDPVVVGGIDTKSYRHKYLLTGNSINSNHSPYGKISNNGMVFRYPVLSENNYK